MISDGSKVEKLHTLRKDCKKLRYILELKERSTDNKQDNGNNHEDDDLAKSIIKLEEMQDSLGEIHDYDALLSLIN